MLCWWHILVSSNVYLLKNGKNQDEFCKHKCLSIMQSLTIENSLFLSKCSCLCHKIWRIHYFVVTNVHKMLTFASPITCLFFHADGSLNWSFPIFSEIPLNSVHMAFKSGNLISIKDSLSSQTKIEILRNCSYWTLVISSAMMSLISFAKSTYFVHTPPPRYSCGHWYVGSVI